jgi:hypothetical protein
MQAAWVLLAVLTAVRDLSVAVLSPLGASTARKASVETFIETSFKLDDGTIVPPNDLIQVTARPYEGAGRGEDRQQPPPLEFERTGTPSYTHTLSGPRSTAVFPTRTGVDTRRADPLPPAPDIGRNGPRRHGRQLAGDAGRCPGGHAAPHRRRPPRDRSALGSGDAVRRFAPGLTHRSRCSASRPACAR